ncbi:MAG: GntR family transcriptional regulator [Blastocatellia bacterium]|nr:GntR family transcriptional regulator [Blastocatellia bacterium]
MRLWLSKNSEVPLREQLATQIVLGIISDDLKPGQKLPSTRELAQRFGIHSNTVSAAYRDLARRGWVEFRKGSGIYVRTLDAGPLMDATLELDQLISTFFRVAREKGFPLREIQSRLKQWLALQPPDHFLVIEPDEELRNILVAEIKDATGFRVSGAGAYECADRSHLTGAVAVALYNQAERVRALLPTDTSCLLLRLRSVPAMLAGETVPPPDALITVVSRWPEFLKWGHTILVAAGVDPDALNFRDARERGWEKGLRLSALVITDALTATRLPADCRVRVFRIIADSSLTELRDFKDFLTRPVS